LHLSPLLGTCPPPENGWKRRFAEGFIRKFLDLLNTLSAEQAQPFAPLAGLGPSGFAGCRRLGRPSSGRVRADRHLHTGFGIFSSPALISLFFKFIFYRKNFARPLVSGNSDPLALLWLWLVPKLGLTLLGLFLLLAGFSAMCKERHSFRSGPAHPHQTKIQMADAIQAPGNGHFSAGEVSAQDGHFHRPLRAVGLGGLPL
jgi:hypothetical protein